MKAAVSRRADYSMGKARIAHDDFMSKPRLKAVSAAMAAMGLLAACGSGVSQPVELNPNARAASLSAGEQALLCDWIAQQFGGYGHTISCDGGETSLAGPQDQATCVSQYMQGFSQPDARFAACTATVGQVQSCLQWTFQNACGGSAGSAPSACAVTQGPACSSG